MNTLILNVLDMAVVIGAATPSHAQALGWEGETGVFVTPLAYTASAEGQKLHPVVAYHYFNAGPVIGDFHETSIELGVGKRVEFGYTHEFHTFGNNAGLSYLWQNGFDIFNGKVNLVSENAGKTKWVPAVSLGFLARTGVRNVGDYEGVPAAGRPVNPSSSVVVGGGMAPTSSGKTNGDLYAVASKVVPLKPIPIVLSAGIRGTNAELWGMGGNAPDWQARAFGAVAFVFKGPARSTIIFGSEAAQQPHHPLGFATATDPAILNIPTTLTYCARVIPTSKYKLNFDFGVAQVAGVVHSGIDLKARHQVGFQMSYGF
jgi:hypothetical protein